MTQARHPERLRAFIGALAELIDGNPREGDLLHRGGKLLAQLVSHDDWLPDEFAQPDPERYQQFLLHADSRQRFSIVSFVWGPGQSTPIHDHRVWGLIGMLRGSEYSQGFERGTDGALIAAGKRIQLEPGQVEAVDEAPAARAQRRLHLAGIGPPADGVGAHPEELGYLTDAVFGHAPR